VLNKGVRVEWCNIYIVDYKRGVSTVLLKERIREWRGNTIVKGESRALESKGWNCEPGAYNLDIKVLDIREGKLIYYIVGLNSWRGT
jgi:hypothetical protein